MQNNQTDTNQTDINQQTPNNNNNYPSNSNRQNGSIMVILARIVWLIAMVIIIILGIRFFFILFGANPANGFVNFIYSISYPLARPFFGIFNYKIDYGVSRVEIASLVAIAIYAIAAYLITRLLTIHRDQTTT